MLFMMITRPRVYEEEVVARKERCRQCDMCADPLTGGMITCCLDDVGAQTELQNG